MRSISQIYSEAVSVRNNYLRLTELDSGRSNSKLSIINLLTYVVSVCIYTYETILDLFQVRIAETLNDRINGTAEWYVQIAKKFQYNPVTSAGDVLVFNENTMKIEYETIDKNHRIIEKAAYQFENENSLTLKVCKTNENTTEIESGMPYTPLSDSELTAFRMFIQQVKFIGADIYCQSLPGDIITIMNSPTNPIFYNDSYITAEQALENIKKSLTEFANNMEFNGILYYQSIIDVIRKTEHIYDVSSGIKVYVSHYNSTENKYDTPILVNSRTRLKSGYIRLLDELSVSTINSTNIKLEAASKINDYLVSQY